jgi:CheY-like chemotaxis protein
MAEKSYKIFLVDDDKFLLDMYSLKFKNKGHQVFTAHDGQDALSQLRGGLVPDAIVMDIIMPTMDGLRLLENIRKEKLIPTSKVIMLTNQGQVSDIEQAEKLGIDNYIIKATTIPSEVVLQVEKVLES